jgi:uncharacterized damage-inducible protein DinB
MSSTSRSEGAPPARTDPPLAGGERETLRAYLDYQRDTLALKCRGLTPGQLRERPVPPSSLSLLGLVRHMAEVERGWFGRVVGQAELPLLYCSDDNPDGEFDDVAGADPAEAFQAWRRECQHARQVEARTGSLADVFARRGEKFSLRWVMLHMIEEYARHNGHADLLRERIDGQTGQ